MKRVLEGTHSMGSGSIEIAFLTRYDLEREGLKDLFATGYYWWPSNDEGNLFGPFATTNEALASAMTWIFGQEN